MRYNSYDPENFEIEIFYCRTCSECDMPISTDSMVDLCTICAEANREEELGDFNE